MELQKLTKQELIALVDKQAADLAAAKEEAKQGRHLATTIEAKDKEINSLKEANKETQRLVKLPKEIEDLEKQITELTARNSALMSGNVEAIEAATKALTDQFSASYGELFEANQKLAAENKVRVTQLNEWVTTHGDLLKVLEGLVNTHIGLNTYMITEIKKPIEIKKPSGGNN